MTERTGTDRRREFLREVEGVVCRDRQNSYDCAEDNFQRIADIANVVLGRKLTEPLDTVDVALFSVCIKMGRLAFNPGHYDSVTDLAGYASCLGGILKAEMEQGE